jgi:signal transduction histidine kinase
LETSFIDSHRLFLESIRQPVVFLKSAETFILNSAARQLFGDKAEQLSQELIEQIRTGELPAIRMHAYETPEGDYNIHYVPLGESTALVFEREPDSRADTELNQLTAAVCNKFRTPLTMLFSASGLLSDKLSIFPDPRVCKYLSVIDQSTYRLLKMVNNISDVSSFLRDSVRLNLQTRDLVAVCRNTVQTVLPIADEQGIELSFECIYLLVCCC